MFETPRDDLAVVGGMFANVWKKRHHWPQLENVLIITIDLKTLSFSQNCGVSEHFCGLIKYLAPTCTPTKYIGI